MFLTGGFGLQRRTTLQADLRGGWVTGSTKNAAQKTHHKKQYTGNTKAAPLISST
jgi:hypothetical protein